MMMSFKQYHLHATAARIHVLYTLQIDLCTV